MSENETQELTIRVRVDAETGKMQIVSDNTDKIVKGLAGAGKESQSLKQSFGQLTAAFGLGNVAAMGSVEALKAIVGTIKSAVDEALAYQKANKALEFQFNVLGNVSAKTRDQVKEYVAELTKGTQYTQTEAIKAFELLYKHTGNVREAQKLLAVATEVASAKQEPLINHVQTLAYAMQFGSRGSRMLKMAYGDVVKESDNFNDSLNRLYTAAQKTNKSTTDLSDQAEILNKNWKELQKNIGDLFVPALETLYKTLNKMTEHPAFKTAKTKEDIELSIKIAEDIIQKKQKALLDTNNKLSEDERKQQRKYLLEWQSILKQRQSELRRYGQAHVESDKDVMKQNVNSAAEEAEAEKELQGDILKAQKKWVGDSTKLAEQMGGAFSDAFMEIVDSGEFTQESLNKVFTNLARSFEKMLMDMLMQYLAKSAVFAILNAFTGGGFGVAQAAVRAGAHGVAGMDGIITGHADGGYVAETGIAKVHKGETIIPANKSGGNTYIINALDIRTLGQVSLRRSLARMKSELDNTLSNR